VEFSELIKKRYSVRAYKPDPVEDEKLQQVLEDVDVAIVMDHVVLAATAQGLGTCWIAAFDPQAARDVLALPDDVEPIVFTPLGYPADEPKPKQRKPLSELVRYERWGGE
jgi:nitroreductase